MKDPQTGTMFVVYLTTSCRLHHVRVVFAVGIFCSQSDVNIKATLKPVVSLTVNASSHTHLTRPRSEPCDLSSELLIFS